MGIHADKSPETEGNLKANSTSLSKESVGSLSHFTDNRPEANSQKPLQKMAQQSGQVAQLRAVQDLAAASFPLRRAIQLKSLVNAATIPDSTSGEANETGLPDSLKTGIESLSGYSMDDVKVHYNSNKPTQLRAKAFASGTEIHLGSGQEKHLPHEAWHVVQQKQGKVKPTVQLKGGINVNNDAGLEREADVMGRRATQMRQLDNGIEKPLASGAIVAPTVQRLPDFANEAEAITYFEQVMLANPGEHQQDYTLLKDQADKSGWKTLLGKITEYSGAFAKAEGGATDDKPDETSFRDKLKSAIEAGKKELVGGIIPQTLEFEDGMNIPEFLEINRDKIREHLMKWLLDALVKAGMAFQATVEIQARPSLVITEFNNVVSTIFEKYSADFDDDWDENLVDGVLDASLIFAERGQWVGEKVKEFERASIEIDRFSEAILSGELEATTHLVTANESTEGATERSQSYIARFTAIRGNLEALREFDFDELLKIEPELVLEKYKLTAGFDNNLSSGLAADILDQIRDYYWKFNGKADQLQAGIEATITAINEVLDQLLSGKEAFPIVISGGIRGDSFSGVTKRNKEGKVSHVLINVGEVHEKLRANAAALRTAVPAFAEFGTLFHELSHAVDHDNKMIPGIGNLIGGHAHPAKVYDKQKMTGWFFDPDFTAAMMLAGLEKVSKDKAAN